MFFHTPFPATALSPGAGARPPLRTACASVLVGTGTTDNDGAAFGAGGVFAPPPQPASTNTEPASTNAQPASANTQPASAHT